MPADFFLVTDKIMLENPHIKRYRTDSKKSTSHIMKILREEFVNLHFVPLTY